MSDVSLKIETLKSKIGFTWEPVTTEISKDMIRRFARAIGDANPLWQDEDYAASSSYRGIVAPPTFVVTIGNEEFQKHIADVVRGTMGGGLHVTTEIESHQLIRPGDVITSTTKIIDVQEKFSKSLGTIALVTFEITYRNQKQEPVSICRQVIVGHEIKDGESG